MNLAAEKLKLIEWLAGLTDATVIERIKLLKDGQSADTDWWNEIVEAEKAALEQGLADSEKGDLIPHQEVRKRYEKWL